MLVSMGPARQMGGAEWTTAPTLAHARGVSRVIRQC